MSQKRELSTRFFCITEKGKTQTSRCASVVTSANMRRVRAVDRIVDLCQRDMAFIWLTKGDKPKRAWMYSNMINVAERVYNVPVLEAAQTALKMLEMYVDMGITHSKKIYMPLPG